MMVRGSGRIVATRSLMQDQPKTPDVPRPPKETPIGDPPPPDVNPSPPPNVPPQPPPDRPESQDDTPAI
jgi:hypothetical protein